MRKKQKNRRTRNRQGRANTAKPQTPVQVAASDHPVKRWLKRLFLPGDNAVENAIFLALILVGAAVRLILLGDIPAGLNQDEAALGYDTWALLEYGIDRHGYHNPVHFVSWGSGQNALYGYFSMPFILAMGLNIVSIRLVQALLGVVSLFAMYAIGRRLADGRFALFALFVLTISPWHVMMSRWGLESNLLPPLLLFSFSFLLRGLITSRYIIPAFFLLSLSLYAYGTAYFFVPIFTLGVLVYGMKHPQIDVRHWRVGLVVMIVTAIPIGLFLAVNLFEWEAIETPLFSMPRYTGVPRYTTTAAFFSADFFFQIWQNGLHLRSLITTGHGELIFNALPEFGYFYRWGGFLVSLVGTGFLMRDGVRGHRPENLLVLLWLVVALLTSITVNPNINRINVIFFPLLLCTAYGLYTALGDQYRSIVKIAGVVALAYLIFSFAAFTKTYFSDYRWQQVQYFAPSYGEAFAHIARHADERETIYLTGYQLHTFALFYARPDPRVYMETADIPNPTAEFQYVKSFDRYVFGIDAEAWKKGNVFLIDNRELQFFSPSDFIIVRFHHCSAVYRRR